MYIGLTDCKNILKIEIIVIISLIICLRICSNDFLFVFLKEIFCGWWLMREIILSRAGQCGLYVAVADQCCSFTELAPRLHEPSLRQSTCTAVTTHRRQCPTPVNREPTHTTVQTHLNLTSTGGRLLSRGNQGDLMSSSSSSRPLIVISQNRLMIDVCAKLYATIYMYWDWWSIGSTICNQKIFEFLFVF